MAHSAHAQPDEPTTPKARLVRARCDSSRLASERQQGDAYARGVHRAQHMLTGVRGNLSIIFTKIRFFSDL